jgi:aryl-alcohol dehydrogenase-like predicted oxidoreductase
LIRAGKVLYAGISDTPAWIASYAQATAELRGWSRLAAYQGEYSLAERGIETDVLPMSKALELAVLAFGMLGGGALTGKFNQPGGPGEPTRASQASEKEQKLAQALGEVAAEIERTASQVAINWVRQQSERIIPILGARRESQIVDNLGVLDFKLSEAQLQKLSEANPQETLYPHSFWNEFVRHDLIFGDRADELDGLRR